MINIANADKSEREVVFLNAAKKAGIANPAIVEKDFWVCFTLDYLFRLSPWPNGFIFKGGTSLSKGYHVIERFSEDIDLVLDWRLLGYKEDEPWIDRSKTQQDKFNKAVVKKASAFLSETLCSKMQEDLGNLLNENIEVSMDKDDPDQCTVNFYYPHVFDNAYIRQEIRLEIGPLAEWTPSHKIPIKSTLEEEYPELIKSGVVAIPTVDVERTFWEKATILHKTAASYDLKGIPARYARHYYDLYSMANTNVKDRAFSRKDLLDQDVKFKSKFYYVKNASYETAHIGTIKLIPSDNAIKDLENDYRAMQDMIYGQKPDFSDIITGLRELEKEINSL